MNPGELTPVPKVDDVFRVVFAESLPVRNGIKYALEAFAALEVPDAGLLLFDTVPKQAERYHLSFEVWVPDNASSHLNPTQSFWSENREDAVTAGRPPVGTD